MDQFKLSTVHSTRFRLLSCLPLLAWLLVLPIGALAAPLPIIISSANSHYQQSVVQSILKYLEGSGIEARTSNINQQATADNNNELVISIGTEAKEFLDKASLSSPQLRVVTQIDVNDRSARNNELYLSMTQPACQQFALIRALNNGWKNVSVLLSDPAPVVTQQLQTCATQYGVTLKIIIISQYINVIDALNTSLINSDVLLALPDASVYNAKTIKSILLTTYRHRIPVIGFSESFVHAGALAAIHSSTDQLGKQIAELIVNHYSHSKINQNYLYPKYFDIAINKDVAKSLAINTPDRKVITEKLRQENNE